MLNKQRAVPNWLVYCLKINISKSSVLMYLLQYTISYIFFAFCSYPTTERISEVFFSYFSNSQSNVMENDGTLRFNNE
jgi:hypothetical protein